MTVHCSNGGSRTGVFIILDLQLDMFAETGKIDLFGAVAKARQSRVRIVGSKAQYVFLHRAIVNEVLTLPNRVLGVHPPATQDFLERFRSQPSFDIGLAGRKVKNVGRFTLLDDTGEGCGEVVLAIMSDVVVLCEANGEKLDMVEYYNRTSVKAVLNVKVEHGFELALKKTYQIKATSRDEANAWISSLGDVSNYVPTVSLFGDRIVESRPVGRKAVLLTMKSPDPQSKLGSDLLKSEFDMIPVAFGGIHSHESASPTTRTLHTLSGSTDATRYHHTSTGKQMGQTVVNPLFQMLQRHDVDGVASHPTPPLSPMSSSSAQPLNSSYGYSALSQGGSIGLSRPYPDQSYPQGFDGLGTSAVSGASRGQLSTPLAHGYQSGVGTSPINSRPHGWGFGTDFTGATVDHQTMRTVSDEVPSAVQYIAQPHVAGSGDLRREWGFGEPPPSLDAQSRMGFSSMRREGGQMSTGSTHYAMEAHTHAGQGSESMMQPAVSSPFQSESYESSSASPGVYPRAGSGLTPRNTAALIGDGVQASLLSHGKLSGISAAVDLKQDQGTSVGNSPFPDSRGRKPVAQWKPPSADDAVVSGFAVTGASARRMAQKAASK
jgi:hypothetical protein